MTKTRLWRFWNKNDFTLFSSPSISIENKLLAYKVFLRPKLIYEWYKNRHEKLKKLELKVLKTIFDTSNQTQIYRMYSEVDVTRLAQVQTLRWQRASNMAIECLQRTLDSFDNERGNNQQFFMRCCDRGVRRCNSIWIRDSSSQSSSSICRRSHRRE